MAYNKYESVPALGKQFGRTGPRKLSILNITLFINNQNNIVPIVHKLRPVWTCSFLKKRIIIDENQNRINIIHTQLTQCYWLEILKHILYS